MITIPTVLWITAALVALAAYFLSVSSSPSCLDRR
jgi:hypothetical protein